MSLSHGSDVVRDGLVLYLDAANEKSYPGTGNQCYDLSGQGNNGALQNGSTVSNGEFMFDGVDDNINMGDVISISSEFSLNIWFKGNPTQTDQHVGLLSKDAPSNFGNYGLYGDSNSTYVRFGFVSTVDSQREISNSTFSDIKSNQWVNYCGTYDLNTLRLYRNGVLISSRSETLIPKVNTNTMSIGARMGANKYFNGSISIVQVYDRGLSEDEVTQNFAAARGRYGL